MLLNQLIRIVPSSVGCLLIGLCDDDPLLTAVRQQSSSEYTTRLYAVSWDGKGTASKTDRQQACYLELGCL